MIYKYKYYKFSITSLYDITYLDFTDVLIVYLIIGIA